MPDADTDPTARQPMPEEYTCHYCGGPAEVGRPWVFVPDGDQKIPAHGDCAERAGEHPPAPHTGPVGG